MKSYSTTEPGRLRIFPWGGERWLYMMMIGLLLAGISTTKLKAQSTYNWGNVAIGGGGFVSAVVTSKNQQNLMYARTDVGGAYRWDAAANKWIPLLDWAAENERGYLGVESLAIDPQAPAKLYILAGISYFDNGKTAILRSTDYGKTFSITDVTSQFKAHGNGMGRQTGEKLVVDPNNGNILFCGTRWNGLFKSTNAGVSWSRVASLDVTTTPNENGISFVVMDKSSSTTGTATKTIYVGVSRSGSTNLYRSTDGGTTFSAVSGAPTTYMPHRATLASDGNLYITYGNGAGPHGHWAVPEPMDDGQIWKYNTSTGAWTNVSPSGINRAFGGISVDPNNANRLVASTINTYLPQGGPYGDRIFISANGGASWTDVIARGFSLDTNGMSWITGHAIHWAGSVEFDPYNTKKVWVTSGNGIFSTDDIDATPCVWKFRVQGLEETVPLDIVSIPNNGPLVSVIGDYDGFRHTNVTQYTPAHTPSTGTTTGLACAAQNTNVLLRVGNNMYYSTNMGGSWTECTKNGNKGKVAISADGNTFLHCPETSTTTYRSTNRGTSWTSVSGLSINEARPVADPVNSNKFYAYDPGSGSVYISTNGGSSFAATGAPGSNGSKVLRTTPGKEGHLWVALYGNGLSRSTNSGQSFTKLSNVTYCGAVGLGKEAPGKTYPTLYIWGTVGGVLGIHRSIDEGATWTRVNDNDHEYGGPGNGEFVIGDMNIYGRVYMSTAGRGIVYGEPVSCTSTAIVPYIQINGGSWQQTASASLAAGGTVKIGPQPTTGGSWSWTGPNNFTATTREITISNIQTAQAGTYTATYTNTSGCQSTQAFSITLTGNSAIVVRARGVAGSETIDLRVNNTTVATWTLTTAYQNFSASGNGTVTVHFTNDAGSRDVQIDYVTIGGVTYQAENQATNTGVWMNNTCGGSNSEWLNCNGYISFSTSSARVAAPEVVEVPAESDLIRAYPNPVQNKVIVRFPQDLEGSDVLFTDVTGKVQLSSKVELTEQTFDLTHAPSGIYMVQVAGAKTRFVLKIVKQ